MSSSDQPHSRSGKAHVTGEGVVTASGFKIERRPPDDFPLSADARLNLAILDNTASVWITSNGQVIEWGMGDDIEEALLDLLPYLLPTDHPGHPG